MLRPSSRTIATASRWNSGGYFAGLPGRRFLLLDMDILLYEVSAQRGDAHTLIRAFRAIDRFDGQHPRAWLLTILRNTHINRNRRRRPELLRDPDGTSRELHEVASVDATDASIDAGFDAEIERALAELDEPFRRVVELIDVAGLSYAEAAEVLGVPTGTVMSRLHRARGRIRDRLDRAGLAPRSH